MSDVRLMIVIGDVLHEPWNSISLRGQVPTWLAEAERPGVVVRHSHANRLGAVGTRLDRWHERARWSTHGRTRVPVIDSWAGRPFRDRVPRVQVTTWGDSGQVAWHQDLPDMYLAQRWKVLGSLTQALTEPFDYVYFTTASSYVRVRELVRRVEELPRSGAYAGTRMVEGTTGEVFASGASRVFSRDVAQWVVDHRSDYSNDVMEDVGIGRVIRSAGIDVIPWPSLNLDSFAALEAATDADLLANFHFRLKSGSGADRQDVALMHRLHERVRALETREGQP